MNKIDEDLELSNRLKRGVLLARKRMLEEKALHDDDVIMGDRHGGIIRMPAKEVLVKYAKYLKTDD